MNRKQAEQIFFPLYKKKLLDRAQKLINYLTHKVEKAARKGKDGIRVQTGLFAFLIRSPRRFIDDGEVREIVLKYFKELGFETEIGKHRCARFYDSFYIDGIGISWRQENLIRGCAICTEGSRLKHLITTGQAPRVIDEKDI